MGARQFSESAGAGGAAGPMMGINLWLPLAFWPAVCYTIYSVRIQTTMKEWGDPLFYVCTAVAAPPRMEGERGG